MGFKMKYEITEDFLPIEKINGTRRRQGRIAECQIGAVHDSGNINSTDQGNIDWAIRTLNENWSWANFFTDYDSIRISIPCFLGVNKIERACSVNSNATLDNELFGGDCNDIAVSGEMCYFSDKEKTLESYNRFVWMWAYIGYYHQWKERFGTISGRLIGHFQLQPWNRTDPMNAFKIIDKTWEQFLEDVDDMYNKCIEPEKVDAIRHTMTINLYGKEINVEGVLVNDGEFDVGLRKLFENHLNSKVEYNTETKLVTITKLSNKDGDING